MDLSRTLDKIFLTLPNYCLGQCISDFYQNYEFIQFCTSSVEAIFICKAFSESPPSPAPAALPSSSSAATLGSLWGGQGAGSVGKAGVGPAGLGFGIPYQCLGRRCSPEQVAVVSRGL